MRKSFSSVAGFVGRKKAKIKSLYEKESPGDLVLWIRHVDSWIGCAFKEYKSSKKVKPLFSCLIIVDAGQVVRICHGFPLLCSHSHRVKSCGVVFRSKC